MKTTITNFKRILRNLQSLNECTSLRVYTSQGCTQLNGLNGNCPTIEFVNDPWTSENLEEGQFFLTNDKCYMFFRPELPEDNDLFNKYAIVMNSDKLAKILDRVPFNIKKHFHPEKKYFVQRLVDYKRVKKLVPNYSNSSNIIYKIESCYQRNHVDFLYNHTRKHIEMMELEQIPDFSDVQERLNELPNSSTLIASIIDNNGNILAYDKESEALIEPTGLNLADNPVLISNYSDYVKE